MTFEEFRQWALDSSRGAALRWEEPEDDEVQVVLGVDDYGARHVIPMPPIFFTFDRGHVSWLNTLPQIAANRSLQRVAYRTSVWTSSNPKYEERPVDDPKRGEMLMLTVAEKGRMEIWLAEIKRSPSKLPTLGDWSLDATDKEGLRGAVPKWLRMAVDTRKGANEPTMPAADMVLGPWGVPEDMLPLESACGPLPNPTQTVMSSYRVVFRPESPGPVIISQAVASDQEGAAADYLVGAMQALKENGNEEFEGPPLGEESHYFRGTLDEGRLKRFTAVWRYSSVFCEVAVASPSGRFKASDVRRYAAIQDKRARAALAENEAGAR